MKNKSRLIGLLILLYILLIWFVVPKDGQAVDIRDNELLTTNISDHYEFPSEDIVEEVVVEEELEVPVEPTPTKNYSDDDLYWLARIISAESRGESQRGQIAVGNVVMNRVKSDKFPNTIKEVIFQKGQFSPVSNGSINKEPYEICIDSAKKVLDGEVVVGEGIYYFYAPKYTSRSNWIRSRQVVEEIGCHRFAK